MCPNVFAYFCRKICGGLSGYSSKLPTLDGSMLSWSAVFSIVTVIPTGIMEVAAFFAGDGV
jgi:hypothetical protein